MAEGPKPRVFLVLAELAQLAANSRVPGTMPAVGSAPMNGHALSAAAAHLHSVGVANDGVVFTSMLMRVACGALVCMTPQLRQRGGGMLLLDCDEGELEQGDVSLQSRAPCCCAASELSSDPQS